MSRSMSSSAIRRSRILAVAKDSQANMIVVMGNRGYGPFAGLLLGN